MVKKSLPVLLLGLLMAGCATTTHITNLTPQKEFRNPNGFYSVEAALTSRQQTLRWQSIRPSVVVDKEFYPMRPTPLMTNRWETLIPSSRRSERRLLPFQIRFRLQHLRLPRRIRQQVVPGISAANFGQIIGGFCWNHLRLPPTDKNDGKPKGLGLRRQSLRLDSRHRIFPLHLPFVS